MIIGELKRELQDIPDDRIVVIECHNNSCKHYSVTMSSDHYRGHSSFPNSPSKRCVLFFEGPPFYVSHIGD